jgi:hypothetical protein
MHVVSTLNLKALREIHQAQLRLHGPVNPEPLPATLTETALTPLAGAATGAQQLLPVTGLSG